MYDFFTFKIFITPDILIFFYYIGALIMPLILFNYRRKFFAFLGLEFKVNWRGKLLFTVIFLCMELFWRMGFEVMIGYFQIHNALMHK